jgi:hypothetical protein
MEVHFPMNNKNARKGQWVQIHQIILKPSERTAQVPEDTKRVPLEMWVKGFLQADAALGELCEIETVTGRRLTGQLTAVEPAYTHGFGNFLPELDQVREQLLRIQPRGTPQEAIS